MVQLLQSITFVEFDVNKKAVSYGASKRNIVNTALKSNIVYNNEFKFVGKRKIHSQNT